MDFVMSKHALERAVDMAVEAHEIRDAFDRPRQVHYSRKTHSDYLTRGRISLVVRRDGPLPTVVTVAWAKPSGWAADAEFGGYEGRPMDDATSRARVVSRARRGKKG